MSTSIATTKPGAMAPFDRSKLAVNLRTAKQVVASGSAFLKMDKAGVWMFGQDEDEVGDQQLLINPASFTHGYVCWAAVGSKKLGEKMVPLGQPAPEMGPVPEGGRGWDVQLGVQMKLLGDGGGIDLLWASASYGGKKEIARIADVIGERLGEPGQGAIYPVVTLSNDSYKHADYGKIYTPVVNVVKWLTEEQVAKMLDVAPAKAPTKAPAKAAKAPAKRK